MKITDAQVVAAEEIASDVYDKQVSAAKGAELLNSNHGLNISSARDFINDYKCMLLGRVFQRAMSAPAIDYFLRKILEKRGPKAHAMAVSSVDQHIAYYEGIRKLTLHAMRSVLEGHKKNAVPLPLEDREASFQEQVLEALKDSPENRKARLKVAPKKPAKVAVVSFAFVRNPDVVAEVLLRANGVCENCTKPAPFERKKDSTPYLEVHHVVRLADGGEDTVENSRALCPNCHRYFHFGQVEVQAI